MRKRVIRTIIYEGEEKWVDMTLSRSLVVGTNIICGDNKIMILQTPFEDSDKESILKRGYDEHFSDADGK